MNGRKWSDEEVTKLREIYGSHTNKELSLIFGRSDTAIQAKAQESGVKLKATRNRMAGTRLWSWSEIEYLKKNAGVVPAYQISKVLGRSFSSVYHKASQLKLKSWFQKKTSFRKNDYNSWTWVKQKINKRDGDKCLVCGYGKHTEVHHIKQVKDGGTDELNNLVTLCPNCHCEADRGWITPQSLLELIKS